MKTNTSTRLIFGELYLSILLQAKAGFRKDCSHSFYFRAIISCDFLSLYILDASAQTSSFRLFSLEKSDAVQAKVKRGLRMELSDAYIDSFIPARNDLLLEMEHFAQGTSCANYATCRQLSL